MQVLNTIKATPALGSFPKAGEVQNTNPPENPGCWCRTCRPVVLNDMRFVVCPDCGNKRCPRANDHRNACTGSNEPGQEGSAYPDIPQSPGSEPVTVPGKWIPVSERMPEPGILVLVYTPPQPGDYPGDVRIGFDYIDPDGDDPTYWFDHGEIYEHFCCVACNGMTGPSEKAPYTHWMPLPAAPQEVNNG